MKFFVLGLLVVSSVCSAGSGSYHMCTDANGKKSFTSEPCPSDQKSETKNYSVTSGAAKSQRLTTDNPVYLQMKSDNRKADIKRELKKRDEKIQGYGDSMENELAILKKKKLRANNNRAGAAWEISISEEMNAVTSKYTTLLSIENEQVRELKDEMKSL